jgi:hypothetical protein
MHIANASSNLELLPNNLIKTIPTFVRIYLSILYFSISKSKSNNSFDGILNAKAILRKHICAGI